jgi:pimeloyl-ACP methyl ester carboxylesterase
MGTPVHVTVWDEAGEGAPTVVMVHGTMTLGTASFEAQRPLAERYRLLVMDRPGSGGSPDIDRNDSECKLWQG